MAYTVKKVPGDYSSYTGTIAEGIDLQVSGVTAGATVVNDVIAVSGAKLTLNTSGRANGVTIQANGLAYSYAGSIATNVTVEAGGKYYLFGGGELTGSISLGKKTSTAAAAILYAKKDSAGRSAVINFDVKNDATPDTALFTNINQVKAYNVAQAKYVALSADTEGTVNLTISVNDGKQEGSYKLATVASALAGKAFTLNLATPTSITVGGDAVSTGKAEYTLRLDSSSSLWLDIVRIPHAETATTVEALTDALADSSVTQITVDLSSATVDYVVAFKGAVGIVNSGTFSGKVIAGGANNASGAGKSYTGTYSLSIAGGTFNAFVLGGDYLSGSTGSITHTGAITTTITGGTFNKAVAGGLMNGLLTANKGVVTQNGAINLTITGGTFNHQVVGGNISSKTANATADRSVITGDVNLTLDSSTSLNGLTFAKSVVGGSWGKGTIHGNVNVTLTGNKAINIGDDLWGACSSDKYATTTATAGEREFNTNIDSSCDRTLTFSGFNATLTCDSIGGFNRLVTEHASKVTIAQNASGAAGSLALGDINEWELGYGSQIKGSFGNNFTGDTLVLGSAANASQMSGTWTVFNNTSDLAFVGFSGISSVTLFGQDASFNGSTWASTNYELSVIGHGQYMQVTTLA